MFTITNPGKGETALVQAAVVVCSIDLNGGEPKILSLEGNLPAVEVEPNTTTNVAAAALVEFLTGIKVRINPESSGWVNITPVSVEEAYDNEGRRQITNVFHVIIPGDTKVLANSTWVSLSDFLRTGEPKVAVLVTEVLRKI